MNLFETILLDTICIIFPLLSYLLYCIYQKTLDIKKEEIIFDVALISSFYLLSRYGNLTYNGIPFIVFDIPLIIAYVYNKKMSVIILSLILVFYYQMTFNVSILICILEYILYYILSMFSKDSKYEFLNLYSLIKIFFITIMIIISPLYKLNTVNDILNLIILVSIFYVMLSFIMFLFDKSSSVINLGRMIESAEEEKRIRTSLFKVTHEIKNPIAVCKGYLDMFDINNMEHSKKYIPILKNEIERVLILLQDFLSISKVKINKDIMDLGVLFDDIKDNFSIMLKEHNIKFDYTELEEVYILADYNRLKQVLVNMIKNSREAIGDNGIIHLRATVNQNNIKIYIEDDGIGMDQEEILKLNEAFYTTKSNGTGLGVYLSNEIIKLHGGSIKYKSNKNKGTRVTITIPTNKKDIKFIS